MHIHALPGVAAVALGYYAVLPRISQSWTRAWHAVLAATARGWFFLSAC